MNTIRLGLPLCVLLAAAVSAQSEPWFSSLGAGAPVAPSDALALSGDVDGDGRVDILWLRQGQNRLVLQRDHGRFEDVTATHLPPFESTSRSCGVLFDPDGDGDLDFLEGLRGAGNRLWLNDGAGRFTLGSDFRFANDTVAVVTADINGDGHVDFLAVDGTSSNTMRVGDGRGGFASWSTRFYAPPRAATSDAEFLDIDGDGDTDLVESPGMVWVNDGTGTFTDESAVRLLGGAPVVGGTVAAGDLDGDGDPDLLLDRIYENDGTGVFTAVSADLQLTWAEFADLDADTRLDLVGLGRSAQTGRTGARVCFFNRPSGNGLGGSLVDVTDSVFPVERSRSTGLEVVDLFGRGTPDLFFATRNADAFYVHAGTGQFELGQLSDESSPTAGYATDLEFADIDGDGDADLVGDMRWGSNGYENVRTWINLGQSHWRDSGNFVAGTILTNVFDVQIEDLNGDGVKDALLLRDSGARRWMAGDGTGGFRAPRTLPSSSPQSALGGGIADFDGDGDADLAIGYFAVSGSTRSCQVDVLLNDGVGNFVIDRTYGFTKSRYTTLYLAFADIDGDGDVDMAAGPRMFRNAGNGSFVDESAALWPDGAALDPDGRAFADLDGDGDVDLVVADPATSQLRLFAGDGSGRFVQYLTLPAGTETQREIHLSDLEGNGTVDIVDHSARIWLGDGTGQFLDGTPDEPSAGDARCAGVVDLDADGDQDVVYSPQDGRTTRVLYSLRRQLAAQTYFVVGQSVQLDLWARGASSGVQVAVQFALAPAGSARTLGGIGGRYGLDPTTALGAVGPFSVPSDPGRSHVVFPVPPEPSLRGVSLWLQGIFAEPGANQPFQLSNVLVIRGT